MREQKGLEGLALGRPNPHLSAGLHQQVPMWPQWLLLIEGDQSIQRVMGPLFPRDHEAPIIQQFHHEMVAAVLSSVETRLGLGYPILHHTVPTPTPPPASAPSS